MILAGSTRGAEAIRTGAPPPSPSGADADEAGASYTQPNLGLNLLKRFVFDTFTYTIYTYV